MNIDIQVSSEFLPHHSSLVNDQYTFAYHIVITNDDDEPITLRQRHWEITDAIGHVEIVDGAGVLGKEPILMPGEQYHYTSIVQLSTPWGRMVGRYQFERLSGTRFWTPLFAFDLKAPVTLH